MDDSAIARAMALTQSIERELDFASRYADGWRKWNLTPKQIEFLMRIHSAKLYGRMLWCNRHVRRAAIEAAISAFLKDFAERASQRYFVTFCWDAGFTREREPVIDMVSLKNQIQHRLRRLRLHGIGVVEIDVLTNITGELGRRLMAHVHCYCWAEHAIRPIVASRTLSRLPALSNELGAPSVNIQAVRQYEISIARLAAYMFKAPSREKNRVPRKEPGKYVLRDAKLQPSSAVRLVEVLSHMEFGDVLFSVGEGRDLAASIRSHFRAAVAGWRGRRWEAPSQTAVERLWASIRRKNGSRKFGPCRIRAKNGQATASNGRTATIRPCNVYSDGANPCLSGCLRLPTAVREQFSRPAFSSKATAPRKRR